jgi:hypothetical protein
MVFNATFNNISVISWWSVLLVEETSVPGENHRHVASRREFSALEKVRNYYRTEMEMKRPTEIAFRKM